MTLGPQYSMLAAIFGGNTNYSKSDQEELWHSYVGKRVTWTGVVGGEWGLGSSGNIRVIFKQSKGGVLVFFDHFTWGTTIERLRYGMQVKYSGDLDAYRVGHETGFELVNGAIVDY